MSSSMSIIPSPAFHSSRHSAATALTVFPTQHPTFGRVEFQPETEEPQPEGKPLGSDSPVAGHKALRLQLHFQYELVELNEDILAQSQEVRRTLAAQYYRLGKMLILELAFKPIGATDRQHFERLGFNWTRCQKAMLIAEEFVTAEEVKGMTMTNALKIARAKRRSRSATPKREKKGSYATTVQSPSSHQQPTEEDDEWGPTPEEELELEWDSFKDKAIRLIGVNRLPDFLRATLAELEPS